MDMKKQELMTKEVQGSNKEKIDDENVTQVKNNGSGDTNEEASTSATGADVKLDRCAVCQSENVKRCTACKSVSYCSVEHQRLHWKTHKNECSPFIIKETGTIGKGWIATRDLPGDTILLEELPAFFAPQWTCYDPPCCVTCGVDNEGRKCSSCSWPICSEKCEKSTVHAENECKFFSTHKMKFPAPHDDNYGFQIAMIRASNLKLKNRKLFDKIMRCQDFRYLSPKNDELSTLQNMILIIHREFLPLLTNLSDEECIKLSKILQVNGYESSPSLLTEQSITNLAILYPQSSMMNHSCIANCFYSMGTPPDFKMRVRTAFPVKKGESLTVLYMNKLNLLQPTSIRQEFLANNHGFICKCERCLDPTELGTLISGIKCQKCRRAPKKQNKKEDENLGYFLPQTPLDISVDPKSESFKCKPLFKCNGCGEKKLFSVLKSSLPSEIQRAFGKNGNTMDPETFIQKYGSGGDYLHENHYLIHKYLKQTLPPFVIMASLDRFELEEKMRRLEFLAEIFDKLAPGLSQNKAEHLFDMMLTAKCLASQYSDQLSLDEKQQLSETVEICLKIYNGFTKNNMSSYVDWLPQATKDKMKSDLVSLQQTTSPWLDPALFL